MLHRLKKRLYFVVAAYFALWAKIVLLRWQPRVIIVTGSSGKTTTLHFIEAQLGEAAVYSHHANSAIGLPFHILGFEPNIEQKLEWLTRLVVAPVRAWRQVPKTKLYIVEADCDRPKEGAFLAKLLRPEVTLWVSVYNTHIMNFDSLVRAGAFKTPQAAAAYEFGNFVAATTKLVLINGDQPAAIEQLTRVQAGVAIKKVSLLDVVYQLGKGETSFRFAQKTVHIPGLHPKELGIAAQMVSELLTYLDMPLDTHYQKLEMPPGRSSVFKGKKGSTIVDSTYNTGLGAMTAILELFNSYPAQPKWVVLGDILELGSLEKQEHEKLAEVIKTLAVERVVLLGKRSKEYIYPVLQRSMKDKPVVAFESPKEVLDYLNEQLHGGETLLFKGARGLEGVIEQLLADPHDAQQLVRRDRFWVKRRQAWGLPR